MRTVHASVYDDRELVRMLSREPELLALADALVATRDSAPAAFRYPRTGRGARRLHRRVVLFPISVALAAGVVAFILIVSPWRAAPSLTDQALAAVGGQEVLHVVITEPAAPDKSLRDLANGQVIARFRQTEVWFDRNRELKKTVMTLDGDVLDEQLETKSGGSTRTGPIYTCAWIAAHPAEATKAGVSCNPSGSDGTTPRSVPERPPTIDQALEGFVDGYQAALASGSATRVGEGTLGGRHVIWLRFNTPSGPETIAIDATTHRPLLIEAGKGAIRLQVDTAETVAYDAAQFAAPTPRQAQSGGEVISQADIAAHEAASALGETALWLGGEWNGIKLVGVTREVRSIRYGATVQHVTDIRLSYAPTETTATSSASSVEIYETTRCLITVGWSCSPRDPSGPQQVGTPFGSDRIQLLRRGALYVSIWSSPPTWSFTSLALARALHPVERR